MPPKKTAAEKKQTAEKKAAERKTAKEKAAEEKAAKEKTTEENAKVIKRAARTKTTYTKQEVDASENPKAFYHRGFGHWARKEDLPPPQKTRAPSKKTQPVSSTRTTRGNAGKGKETEKAVRFEQPPAVSPPPRRINTPPAISTVKVTIRKGTHGVGLPLEARQRLHFYRRQVENIYDLIRLEGLGEATEPLMGALWTAIHDEDQGFQSLVTSDLEPDGDSPFPSPADPRAPSPKTATRPQPPAPPNFEKQAASSSGMSGSKDGGGGSRTRSKSPSPAGGAKAKKRKAVHQPEEVEDEETPVEGKGEGPTRKKSPKRAKGDPTE
ncbi:Hypothetical predicted protein [Lecanosticta acicola]|uniref:Uncharacterized protein n=1 Tax=Lecanosticta acicola TaxID=111012 RepID=A0AAI8W186_9PEZI|nr:Hypothetical predicted protein [Lecanosticta acicola]